MPNLFCPVHYTGLFCTLQYLSPDFGVKLVEWQFGQPRGHAFLPTMFEAVKWALEQGLTLATPQMQEAFEMDVINGG